MNEDIKNGLDAELPPGRVPFSLDTDSAVRLGRRTRKRRRLIAGGGSVLSAVAVAGLIVTVLPGGQPTGDDAADDKTAEETDFPELDPKFQYGWANGGFQESDPPKPIEDYTNAFWDHLDENYPDAEISWFGGESEHHAEREDAVYFYREEQSVVGIEDPTDPESEHADIEFDRTAYSLIQWDDTPEVGGASSPEFKFTEGAKTEESLNVFVFPAGSYDKDSGDVFDPAGCSTSHTDFVSCDAEKSEGPDGQDLRHVSMKIKDDGAPPIESDRSVVYYRSDGSAVLVSDTTYRMKESEPAPSLSYEQLAEFAYALPETPVE